jgi:glycosyltransferase involved in cell wall biosynthesis
MKASRVFAFPSTREGFGIVVLEANGCGLPVITTDDPQNAARHWIKEGLNGMTISLSKEALASAIAQYLAMDRTSTSYTSILQEYDWKHLVQKIEDLFALQHYPEGKPNREPAPQQTSVPEEDLVTASKSGRAK